MNENSKAEIFNQLNAIVNSRSLEIIATDLDLLATYTPVVEKFLSQSGKDLMQERQQLPVALKFIAALGGIEEAHRRLFECLDKGVSGSVAAISSIQVSRRLQAYREAPFYLQEIYYTTGKSPYVGYFLAEAFAASGDYLSLEAFSQSTYENWVSLPDPSDRDTKRWAALLADFAFSDLALKFTSKLPEGEDKDFLRSRLATYSLTASSDVPIHVINLATESRKWGISCSSLKRAGYNNVTRHQAVPGNAFPTEALELIVPSKRIRNLLGPGATAAWLSHWAVWEKVASSPNGIALVLEDDALPFTGASRLGSMISTMQEFDLVWVNDRMSGISHQNSPSWEDGVIDPWSQLLSWPSNRQGWGADGYLITSKGAAELLEMCRVIGIQNHVDGQMGAFSTVVRGEPKNAIQKQIVDFQRTYSPEKVINAISMNIPLVRARPFGLSSTVTITRD